MMPTWIKEVQALAAPVGALFTVAIAYIGLKIADQQALTARQKLRLDLYPKRIYIYHTVADAVIDALNENEPSKTFTDVTRKLNRSLRDARFLFPKDVFEYLVEIERVVLQIRAETARLIKSDAVYNQELSSRRTENMMFLGDSLSMLPQKLQAVLKIDETSSFSLAKVEVPDIRASKAL